jgi:hypothetical protein
VTALMFEILELCRRSLWINLRLAWKQTDRELDASRT